MDTSKPGDLKPRAIAVLVVLRAGSRTARALAAALGEPTSELGSLLLAMKNDKAFANAFSIELITHTTDGKYRLTMSGVAWLQNRGLDASEEAKREIFG